MASLIRTTCFMILLGMVSSWPYPYMIERRVPITYVQTTLEEGSGPLPSSIFDDMDRMMASMHERFQHMFNWPVFPVHFNDFDYDISDAPIEYPLADLSPLPGADQPVVDIEKKLDAVQPVCTTTTDVPTTISPRKSRRKKPPTTHTTRCVKELIVNGQKHFSEEVTTTDDKGVVITHSKSSGAVSVDVKPAEQLTVKE